MNGRGSRVDMRQSPTAEREGTLISLGAEKAIGFDASGASHPYSLHLGGEGAKGEMGGRA